MIEPKEAISIAQKEYPDWVIHRAVEFPKYYLFCMAPKDFSEFSVGEEFGIDKNSGEVIDMTFLIANATNPKLYEKCKNNSII